MDLLSQEALTPFYVFLHIHVPKATETIESFDWVVVALYVY